MKNHWFYRPSHRQPPATSHGPRIRGLGFTYSPGRVMRNPYRQALQGKKTNGLTNQSSTSNFLILPPGRLNSQNLTANSESTQALLSSIPLFFFCVRGLPVHDSVDEAVKQHQSCSSDESVNPRHPFSLRSFGAR